MKKARGGWMLTFLVLIGIGSFGFLVDTMQPRVEQAPSIADRSEMLQVGEVLEYEVSYAFFNIGKIRIQVMDREVRNGNVLYKSIAYIDSNPSLSWLVDLHIRFYSEMDDSVFSYTWISDDSSNKEIIFRRFEFDYGNNRALLEAGKKLPGGEKRIESVDTVSITERCQDGLSLFFFARENVQQKKQMRVPTLIEKKPEYTFINFMNKRTDVEIDAVDYPVEVLEFDGEAEYVGVFGLTGGFRGWFSNDEARVPILARMNVILGSIRIELVNWKRVGWQPPKYVEELAR